MKRLGTKRSVLVVVLLWSALAAAAPKEPKPAAAKADERLAGCKVTDQKGVLTAKCAALEAVATRLGDLGTGEEMDGRLRRYAMVKAGNATMERETLFEGVFRLEVVAAATKDGSGKLRALGFRDEQPAWQVDCADPRSQGRKNCLRVAQGLFGKLSTEEALVFRAPRPRFTVAGRPPANPATHAESVPIRKEIGRTGGRIDADGDGQPETVVKIEGRRRTVEVFEKKKVVQRLVYEQGLLYASDEDLTGDGRMDQTFRAAVDHGNHIETWEFDEDRDGRMDVRRTWTTIQPGGPTEKCHDKLERFHKGEWVRERDKPVACSEF